MATSTPRDPLCQLVAVTPSDTVFLTPAQTRAVWVGGSGTISVVMFDQYIQSANTASVLISSIPAGTLLPISVVRVNNAGTTAAAILAGY